MEWNAENQLTRVTKNAVEQSRFKYDPLGRRVEKVAGGVTTTSTYDGEDIFREVNGASTLKYVQGPGIDEPLATDDGSALSYFHADGLASVGKATSTAGGITLTRRYDAWGNLEVGASTSGYAFSGREHDPQTILYYYRARYYDPKIGRFLTEDPIGFAGGDNFYLYADINPTTLVDPFGLSPGSTMGGDDPAFKDRKRFIQDLEKQLRDPNLAPRERERIKRRLKELRRRPSGRQQHHREEVPFCDRYPGICAPVNACKAHPVECAVTVAAGAILLCVAPEAAPVLAIP
jgi:RHS repeat-associated protein